ncbi:growth arrest-specific protein 1-like [Gigantopelta aegis]|uniref:growth arrest-specific protein 1-like n=1 Tax=Gigantopelta aegis TaxID=1735272 RepID=UPI001B888A49|nr:growth arrest-specific protein 1-like [Gigantopelta aegis]
MRLWEVWLVAMSMHLSSSLGTDLASSFCDVTRIHCLSRTGCNMALKNFFVGCSDVIYGKVNSCTVECKHALLSLLSTEDQTGISFINCNCSGEEFCETRKKRVEICTADVLSSMNSLDDHDAVVSCSLAKWICEADTSCLTALEYYARHCIKLLIGNKCTLRCNNSLSILYRQPNSRKLQTCRCDGSEDYDCQTLKDNTERLCFHRDVPRSSVSSGSGEHATSRRHDQNASNRSSSSSRRKDFGTFSGTRSHVKNLRLSWRRQKRRRARHLNKLLHKKRGRRRKRHKNKRLMRAKKHKKRKFLKRNKLSSMAGKSS